MLSLCIRAARRCCCMLCSTEVVERVNAMAGRTGAIVIERSDTYNNYRRIRYLQKSFYKLQCAKT